MECDHCGTCCLKGGPALHNDDLELIETGRLPITSLYTIRAGEVAYNNVDGCLIQLHAELIKIKSHVDSRACMFYDESDRACRIYENRPCECGKMECWNTAGIESLYSESRLTRKKVLKKMNWLQDLVDSHEEKCSYDEIKKLLKLREAGDQNSTKRLQEIINYDMHLRDLAIKKGEMPAEIFDFLMGRPLVVIVSQQFGIKINPS